jgi:hypothetical protein
VKTMNELIQKYGVNELRRARNDLKNINDSTARFAILYERFGRDAPHIANVLDEIPAAENTGFFMKHLVCLFLGHDWIYETDGEVGGTWDDQGLLCKRFRCQRCKMHRFQRVDEGIMTRRELKQNLESALTILREVRADGCMEEWGNDLPQRIDALFDRCQTTKNPGLFMKILSLGKKDKDDGNR